MKSKLSRMAAAFAGLVVLIVAIWVRNDGGTVTRDDQASPSLPTIATVRDPSAFQPKTMPQFLGDDDAIVEAHTTPIVIDDVTVEKLEVCRGEENVATVSLHTLDGRDRDLSIGLVSGLASGFRLPFRLTRETAAGDMPQIIVEGPTSQAVVRVPAVHVKDCAVDRILRVRSRSAGQADDEFAFTAALADTAEGSARAPFVPTRYDWDFGDGSTLSTSGPEAQHSYKGRPQDRRYSYFLVRVTASDGRVEHTGSETLDLVNVAYLRKTQPSPAYVSASNK